MLNMEIFGSVVSFKKLFLTLFFNQITCKVRNNKDNNRNKWYIYVIIVLLRTLTYEIVTFDSTQNIDLTSRFPDTERNARTFLSSP